MQKTKVSAIRIKPPWILDNDTTIKPFAGLAGRAQPDLFKLCQTIGVKRLLERGRRHPQTHRWQPTPAGCASASTARANVCVAR